MRKPQQQIDFTLDVWCNADDERVVLQRELDGLDGQNPHAAALLLYEMGRIELALGNEVDGVQQLLRSYTLRPQFRPTVHLARLIYHHRGEHSLVVKLLDAEARATRDPLTRAALLRQQGHVLWLRLGDHEAAQERLSEALRLDATNLATLKLLDLLALRRGDPAPRHEALRRQIEVVADVELRMALLVDIALSLPADEEGKTLEGAAKSLDLLREALALRPDALSVQLLLEQQLISANQLDELPAILLAQAEQPNASQAQRARLHARVGRLYRGGLDDPSAAIEQLLASLALAPELGVAADCFDLLVDAGQIRAAIEVGAQLFDLRDSPRERAALACRLGDLSRRELEATELAIGWYRRSLRSEPSYQPAIEGLARLLEATGDLNSLLLMHRADLAAAKTQLGRAQRLYRLGTVYQRADRATEAIEAHREALAAHPGFLPAVAALEQLFSHGERWTELLQLYDEQIGRETDADRVVHLLETMAAIWYHQLGHLDNAIACYQRVLEHSGDNLSVLRAAARLCAEARRWDDLQQLNEREVELLDSPQRRAEVLQRAGEIWEERLLDLDRAVDCYRRALAENPRYLPALRALGRLYRQRARWRELIEMHRAEIVVSSDPQQIIALLESIAEVYEDELLEPKRAAKTHQEILARRPNHRPSIHALTRLLAELRRDEELAALLESSIDIIPDNRGKALRLWTIGLLREERLGDRAGALREHARALRLTPDLAPAQATLARLYEQAGDVNQLFDLLAANLERTDDPQQRATLALYLADLIERQGDNPRQAAQLYERSAEGADPPLWSLWSLVRLYRRLGARAELCHALERLLAAVEDEGLRTELWLALSREQDAAGLGDPLRGFAAAREAGRGQAYAERASEALLRQQLGDDGELDALLAARVEQTRDPLEQACICTELAERRHAADDLEAAERWYQRALSQMRGHLGAAAGLGLLLEQQERWRERAELAEQTTSSLESTRELAAALFAAGVLWEDKVGDTDRAARLYERALQVQTGHPQAYGRLRAIHEAAKAWPELASLIRGQITATSGEPLVAEMFRELGRIYLEHLGQPRKAEACLRRVVDLSPFDTYALLTLAALYVERGKWQAAEQAYSQAEAVIIDPTQRREVRIALADVYRALHDPLRAFEALCRALEDTPQPDPSLLGRVAEAAEEAGRPRVQAEMMERLADLSADPAEQISLRKRVAQLAEERLDEADRAVRALQQVLVIDPLDMEAIEQLAGIYGRLGNRSAVNQHLQAAVSHHRAELAARRPFDAQLYRQIGRIFRWQRLFDRLYCSCVVLTQLGAITDTEQHFADDHARRCSVLLVAPLAPQRLERLLLPLELASPLRPFLRQAQRALRKLLAEKPAQRGLSRGSRAAPKSPVRAAVAELGQLIGVTDFELWISAQEPDSAFPTVFSGPSLVIGEQLAGRMPHPTAADRFRIGHALFLLSEGALLLQDRSIRRIRALFAALGQYVQPRVELPIDAASAEEIPEELAAVSKALGRKERKQLSELLTPLAPIFERLDVGAFARALGFGANRAGLVLAGDPAAALREARRELGLGSAPPQAGAPNSDALADLFNYLVSEEYFTLRVELGLAPGSA